MPPYHSALSQHHVPHGVAETVRPGNRAPGVTSCLERVWDALPYLSTLIRLHPSSSGIALPSSPAVSYPFQSKWHVGFYDPGHQEVPNWPSKTSSPFSLPSQHNTVPRLNLGTTFPIHLPATGTIQRIAQVALPARLAQGLSSFLLGRQNPHHTHPRHTQHSPLFPAPRASTS